MKFSLAVKPRTVFGKKLKQLRRQGQIAANIFGQEFKSQSVAVDFKDFIKIYRQAKETGVIYLQLNKEEIPVLTQNIQRHPVKDTILHVDFRKVDLTKKIETAVPVKIIGRSEAVAQKGGVLLTQMNELMIEARPEDLPPQIEIDISVLKEINQEIKVADLVKNTHYLVKDAVNKVIVSVVAHKEEAVVPETTTAAPEIITEKKEAEAGEETPKEESKPPAKPPTPPAGEKSKPSQPPKSPEPAAKKPDKK